MKQNSINEEVGDSLPKSLEDLSQILDAAMGNILELRFVLGAAGLYPDLDDRVEGEAAKSHYSDYPVIQKVRSIIRFGEDVNAALVEIVEKTRPLQ